MLILVLLAMMGYEVARPTALVLTLQPETTSLTWFNLECGILQCQHIGASFNFTMESFTRGASISFWSWPAKAAFATFAAALALAFALAFAFAKAAGWLARHRVALLPNKSIYGLNTFVKIS